MQVVTSGYVKGCQCVHNVDSKVPVCACAVSVCVHQKIFVRVLTNSVTKRVSADQ